MQFIKTFDFQKKWRFSSVLVKYNFFYKVILLFFFFPVEERGILSNIQHFQGQNIYFLNVSGPPSSESSDCPLIQGNIIIGKSFSNKNLERVIFFSEFNYTFTSTVIIKAIENRSV